MNNKTKQHLQTIIKNITQSYDNYPVSQAQFRRELPNKQVITDITEKLLEIIFPGYFGEISPDMATLPYHIGNIILEIEKPLEEQITLALSSQYCVQKLNSGFRVELEKQAQDICLSLFQSIPKFRELLSYDVQAAVDGDPAAVDSEMVIFCYPGIYAIAIYRIAHELLNLNTPHIPRILTEYAHSKTGIDIHPGAKIGKYFFIDHGTGVVIGETTVIGDHVKLYQGVTLGGLSTKGGRSLAGIKRHPTIEDNVTIYSGATVLGGETVIGKNVTIGGNAFVTESKYKLT